MRLIGPSYKLILVILVFALGAFIFYGVLRRFNGALYPSERVMPERELQGGQREAE